MADQVGVSPDELRRVAADVHDVRDRMHGVHASLSEGLAGVGPAWGNDNPGHEFHDGAKGYGAQHEWVSGSIKSMADDVLGRYADALNDIANSFQQADEV
jgi:uncharacterized protein YukE